MARVSSAEAASGILHGQRGESAVAVGMADHGLGDGVVALPGHFDRLTGVENPLHTRGVHGQQGELDAGLVHVAEPPGADIHEL